ncbi:MAG TPA: hypothetical protein VGL99_14890 [Chloroflexota bacterium]|jgi:hypothetical protein
MKWSDQLAPLVFGSALANRVPAGAETGPLPYLFFSGLMDQSSSAEFSRRVRYLLTDGRDEFVAARRAIGAVGETVYLVHAPQGDVALVVLDAPGANGVYDALGGALRPFHQWLERRALDMFELRPGRPGPAGYGEHSEVVFRWAALSS